VRLLWRQAVFATRVLISPVVEASGSAELPAGMTSAAMMPIVGQRGRPFSRHAPVRLLWRQAVFATGFVDSPAIEASGSA